MSLNNEAYAAALAEIEEDRLDKGTWARAFAESGGDEAKAKARYIKARAESINSSPTWSDTQPPVEDASKMRVEPVSSSGKGFSATRPSEYYEAAIGESNTVYYIERFQTFDERGPGLYASWNWAAFIFTAFWALYRKMYAWFFAWWVFGTVGTVLLKVPNPQIQQGVGLAYIACFLGFAIYSNSLYHHKVKAKISSAQKSNSDQSGLRGKLSAVGGVNGWVPIVCGAIPVLGIVAAVALPAYQDYSKGRAVAAKQVLAPAPQDWGKNDAIVPAPTLAPAAQQFDPSTAKLDSLASVTASHVGADKGVISPQPHSSQIDDFLDGKPKSAPSERGPWQDYQYKDGVEARKRGDFANALPIFRMLAEQGHARAQGELGVMYTHGHGVRQDYSEAVKWYRLASVQGNSNAQQNLGVMLLLGQGVPKDYVRGHMWVNLASAAGDEDSIKARDAAEVLMTPQQIAQAQNMARDCQQRNFKECN